MPPPLLTAIEYVGSSEAFAKLGFSVTPQDEVWLDRVVIRCIHAASDRPNGLWRLGFANLLPEITELAGVPVFSNPASAPPLSNHRNTAFAIDHVVVYSTCHSEDDTVQSFAKAGIPLRKRSEVFQNAVQLFFRPGNGTILEVLYTQGGQHVNPLWGLTLAVKDISQARACLLDDQASSIRAARQVPRQILTIRHEAVGLHTNMAWMTEHVSSSGSKL
jgi:hypothetical protein